MVEEHDPETNAESEAPEETPAALDDTETAAKQEESQEEPTPATEEPVTAEDEPAKEEEAAEEAAPPEPTPADEEPKDEEPTSAPDDTLAANEPHEDKEEEEAAAAQEEASPAADEPAPAPAIEEEKPTPAPAPAPAPAAAEEEKPAAKESSPVKEASERKEKEKPSKSSSPSPKKARAGDKPHKDDNVQEKATVPIKLEGTFKTSKGREISGAELAQSLERQYNAPCGARRDDNNLKSTSDSLDSTTGKKVSPEELDEIFGRLYTSGQRDRNAPEPKAEIVQAKFENGREVLSPVKKVSYEEQTAYMCELYTRCIDSKKKAEEKLAEKYLKPLGKAKH